MKRIFTLLIVFTSGLFYAQTNGITYQAVIYNPAGEILPGNNNLNAVLANQDICLRFSIKDAATNLEYQETQKVKTDEFGMVNLVIGQGNQVSGYASNFDTIHWNSATKKLQVEMDITGNCSVFIEVSNQNFSAVPFAYASKTAENVSGIVAIANGGTGASTVSGAKTNLGLNNVDNTSDANKPISTATQAALDTKAPLASPALTGTPTVPTAAIGTNSTQIANTAFVNSAIAAAVTQDATNTVKGKLKLTGDLGGTADAPTVPGLVLKAPLDSPQFIGTPTLPTGTIAVTQSAGNNTTAVATTAFVNSAVAANTVVDATTTTKGKIKLAGDLAGTADAPTVPGLANKENTVLAGTTAQYYRGDKTWQTLNKTAVGLGNVDNTSDASKPVSTATQTALNAKEDSVNKSTNISLGTSDVLFPTQNAVKTYVDNQVSSGVVDATTTTKGKIKLAGDLAGTADAPTVPGLANKENTIAAGTTAQYYRGDKTWQTLDKSTVGLPNVDNTSDANKPVSIDTQTALNLKANLVSPTFTGDAKAVTATTGDSDTSIATTAFVNNAITNAATPDATTSNLGKIQLGGDLAGPNSSATVPVITTGAITALKLADASVTNAKIGETIAVANGGTGATSLTGYLKGNGTSAFTTESTIPVANVAGAVRSVNGALPATDGNVSVLIGNVYTGNVITPTTGTTPVRSDIYIVAGQTGTPNDNGRTFIYDGTTWHEISTNIAALDNTFVKLSGSTMSGNLVFPTGKKITIADAPTGSTDVANRGYVDTKIGGSGTTNYVPKFLGTSPSNTLTNSSIFDDGTKVGIGTTTPTTLLSVHGSANVDNANANTGTIANSLLFGNGTGEGIGSTRTGTTNLFGINFFTNYTLQMALTSAGRLGLGTSNPFTPLSNTSSNIFGSDGQGVNGFSWSTGGSGYTAAIYNSGNLASHNGLAVKVANNASTTYALDVSRGTAQATAGTPLFDVLGNGNVGIGTASPASKLDVSAGITSVNSAINATGSINDFLQYNIQNTSSGTQAQSGYSATADNGNATSGFAWLGINNSGFNYPTAYNIGGANDVSFVGSGQDMYLANANNTKSIIFSTGKSTTPFFNEQMRILNNGNVGIGTNAPANKLEIKQGTAGNSGLRFTNLNSSSAATTSASKVLGLNSTGDVILTNIPGTQNIVSFSTASPNTGSPVFTPNIPTDQSVIYQSATDNSLWTYNGTTYVTYTAPATTAWNLAGTTNDAGNNKTTGIWRSGGIAVGGSSNTPLYGNITAIGGTNFSGVPAFGTASLGLINNSTAGWSGSGFLFSNSTAGSNAFSMVYNNDKAYFGLLTPSNGVNNFGTWSSTGLILGSNGNPFNRLDVVGGTAIGSYAGVNTAPTNGLIVSGNVGIGTTSPSTTLHVNNPSLATNTVNADAQVFRMMRPQTPGVKWENIAQFNLGAYSSANTNASSRLDLAMNDGGSVTTSSVMTWQANGNVGIRNTAPTATLDVNSSTVASNTVNADITVLKFARPLNSGVKFPNIAQFNLGSYTTGGQSNTRLDLNLSSINDTDIANVMTWQANGYVGIGTTAPVSSFANTASAIQGSNSTNAFNGGLTWSTPGTGFVGSFYSQPSTGNGLQVKIAGNTSSNNALEVSTGATQSGTTTPLFNVLGNGSVGVGTNAPTGQFEVATPNGYAAIFRRGNTSGGASNIYLQRTQNADPNVNTAGSYSTDVIGKVIFSMANGTNYPVNGNASIESFYTLAQTTSNAGGGLTFKSTLSGTTTSTERMRIDHNGNIGIGTNSPTTNLDVVGGFSLRNAVGSAGSNYGIEFNTNSTSPRIDWVYNGNYTGSFAGDSDFYFRLQNSKQGSGGFRFTTNPSGSAVERLTILNNGNIGIGITNPTALLEISSTSSNGVAPKLRLTNGFVGGKKWELQSGIAGISDASFGIYNVTDNLQVLTAKATGEVGIGTSSPDASAKLDLTATNKGFLPPRVSLTGTADVSTIATPATGLLVYNTATTGTAPAAVQPGYYYYNGSRWVSLAIPGGASVNVQAGAYTLTENDSKGVVIINSATAVNVTVPATLPAGFFCQIIQKGAGAVTVSGATGVTIQSANGLTTRAQFSSIGLMMESSATGYVSGDSGL